MESGRIKQTEFISAYFNRMGEAGWELVFLVHDIDASAILTFKRLERF
jgi:hypothetical protein